MSRPSVCIIGAGPAGIMAIQAFQEHFDVQAYEKANEIGGQWALNTDKMTAKQYGSRSSSIYNGLMSNAPKEAGIEVANFPWKNAVPSFIPARQISQYLLDFAENFQVEKHIKTHSEVQSVLFKHTEDKFYVKVHNVETEEIHEETYDYVCVGSGHFAYPHDPAFEGEKTFTGQILHSHDFTDGADFKGKRVLNIGGSYSAEDIALLCWKNGALKSHVSSRSPGGFGYVDWPNTVEERPNLKNISGSTVTFVDGTSDDFDVIIKSTGFIHKFPFLPDELQINCVGNSFVPNGLYEQCVSIQNPKLFFFGMQNLAYTNPMFQLQAYFIRDIIRGKIAVPDQAGRKAGFDAEKVEENKFTSVFSAISFQTNYLNKLSKITKEAGNDTEHIWVDWVHEKQKSIMNFRKKNYKSVHSGLIYNC